MSRAYGWSSDGSIDPAEATVIRHMADHILAGGSMKALLADLADREIPTVSGKPWAAMSVKRILMSARVIGCRTDPRAGDLVDAPIDPILDREQWTELHRIFGAPDRARFTPRAKTGQPDHRPVGLAADRIRCGLCAGMLYVDRARHLGYRCSVRSGGCGRLSITAPPVDADLTERVLARLIDPVYRQRIADGIALVGGPDGARARIEQIRDRLRVLGEDFADGLIERDTMLAGTDRGRRELAVMRTHIDRAGVVADVPSPDAVITWWEEEASMQARRDVVGVLLDHVTVRAATSRGAHADVAARLTYHWRGE